MGTEAPEAMARVVYAEAKSHSAERPPEQVISELRRLLGPPRAGICDPALCD